MRPVGKEDTVTELKNRDQNIFLVFNFFLLFIKKLFQFKKREYFPFKISADIKYNYMVYGPHSLF